MSAATTGPTTGPAPVTDTGVLLPADPARVITRFFVAGREDSGPGDSRAGGVVDRILHLDDAQVTAALAELDRRFEGRHQALHDVFRQHASMVVSLIGDNERLSAERVLLLGAAFTHEYAIEGAALCNPSAVLHPVQDASGDASFVISVRGIGEGHRSCIGFRTGRVTAAGVVTVDAPGPFPRAGVSTPGLNDRGVVHVMLAALDDDHENAAYVLDSLPPFFSDADLDARLRALTADGATRRNTVTTIANLRALARSSYCVAFPPTTGLSERVLWPQAPAEDHGMEDARFVRFTHDDGTVTYYGTYTAYDGANIAQHLLETTDFASFTASPVAGAAAKGKGLALFPRKVGGRFAALSRSDRETNAVAFSDDVRWWPEATVIQSPEAAWEILQLGNCGPPIETDQGWLVLTHGVGPMRTYAIGALLLDLDDPAHVLGWSDGPILSPPIDRPGGYVPNVVYSCGGFVHGDTLVLPYGVADQSIAIATLSIDELLGSLHRGV